MVVSFKINVKMKSRLLLCFLLLCISCELKEAKSVKNQEQDFDIEAQLMDHSARLLNSASKLTKNNGTETIKDRPAVFIVISNGDSISQNYQKVFTVLILVALMMALILCFCSCIFGH